MRADRRSYEAVVQPRSNRNDCAVVSVHFSRQRRNDCVKTARSWRGIVPFTHLTREERMTVTIGRRELLAALGGAAAAWPLTARGQQSAMPVVGFLGDSPREWAPYVAAFVHGLKEIGYVDGGNVRI